MGLFLTQLSCQQRFPCFQYHSSLAPSQPSLRKCFLVKVYCTAYLVSDLTQGVSAKCTPRGHEFRAHFFCEEPCGRCGGGGGRGLVHAMISQISEYLEPELKFVPSASWSSVFLISLCQVLLSTGETTPEKVNFGKADISSLNSKMERLTQWFVTLAAHSESSRASLKVPKPRARIHQNTWGWNSGIFFWLPGKPSVWPMLRTAGPRGSPLSSPGFQSQPRWSGWQIGSLRCGQARQNRNQRPRQVHPQTAEPSIWKVSGHLGGVALSSPHWFPLWGSLYICSVGGCTVHMHGAE